MFEKTERSFIRKMLVVGVVVFAAHFAVGFVTGFIEAARALED